MEMHPVHWISALFWAVEIPIQLSAGLLYTQAAGLQQKRML